jgi:TetR/AcrR family transcriptional regulator
MSVKQRRARERQARRAAILDAAEEVLHEVGYRNLRMEEVAEAAELSKGTLYLYFDGKDALCAGIAERRMRAIIPQVRAAGENAPNGLTAIGRMSRRFFEDARDTPHVLRLAIDWFQAPLLYDASEDFRRYRERVGEMQQLMIDTIGRGQQDGSIRTDVDPFHKAIQSWSSAIGVHLFLLDAESMQQRMGRPFDPVALRLEHVKTTLRSLASQPEAADAALAALDPGGQHPSEPPLRKAAGDR